MFFVVLSVFCTSTTMANQSPIGLWKVMADSNQISSDSFIVMISKDRNNLLTGKISRIQSHASADTCFRCPGNLKGKAYTSINALEGFVPVGENRWGQGRFLDVNTGKRYNAIMTLNNNELTINAYANTLLLSKRIKFTKIVKKSNPAKCAKLYCIPSIQS